MKRATSVDEYISFFENWKESLEVLRELISSTELEEEVKWGMPVYTLKGKNVAGFSAFKAWTGIWFFQGVFLKDEKSKLINAQEGVTKALRQWRFTSADEIRENRDTVTAYLQEAIQNQKEGKEIKPERNKPVEIPEELASRLKQDPALRDRFESLTPGKKREYAEHIGSAKGEETRLARLEKAIPLILEGIGLNDKYK